MVIPLDQKSSGSSPDGATKKALLRAFFVATVGSLHATILHATIYMQRSYMQQPYIPFSGLFSIYFLTRANCPAVQIMES